jgi:nucleoside-diphosphate-sugar epimerase
MVIGNGLLAKIIIRFIKNNNFVYFASGVSNSRESSCDEFNREESLLKKYLNKNERFIYFSSVFLDEFSKLSPYVQHKIKMENIVKTKVNGDYLIFRLPQIVGISSNPNTLVNFLYHKIKYGIPFDLYKNTKRNLIDVEDAARIVVYIAENNFFLERTLNIISPNFIDVEKIIKVIEDITNKKAAYSSNIERSQKQNKKIDFECSKNAAKILKIRFGPTYFKRILIKYYKFKSVNSKK